MCVTRECLPTRCAYYSGVYQLCTNHAGLCTTDECVITRIVYYPWRVCAITVGVCTSQECTL